MKVVPPSLFGENLANFWEREMSGIAEMLGLQTTMISAMSLGEVLDPYLTLNPLGATVGR